MIYINPKQVNKFGGFDQRGSFDDFDAFRSEAMKTKVEGERPI